MADLFGGTLPIPLAVQVQEVEREVALRRRVYPRWVEAGKMTQAAADRQIATMEAVAATLRQDSWRCQLCEGVVDLRGAVPPAVKGLKL